MSDHPADARLVSRPSLSPIDALTDALISERRLLEELITVMRRQRSAVGDDDLQSVDDSVFATHRVLVTLNEARRRRRALIALIGQPEDIGLQALERALGSRVTPALREAHRELHTAARALSHEVSLNRRVLREALARGEQTLDPTPQHVRAQPKKRQVSGRRRRDEP
jgi:FlgN protein